MTSKLTITDDKLSALLSEMEKSFTGCQGHGYTDAAEEYGDMISALRELQERRKAAMDSEPVYQCEFTHAADSGELQWHWEDVNEAFYEQYGSGPRGRRRILYSAPQPGPVADSEPVAWTDEEELRDVNVAGIGYLFGIDREANKFADPRRQIMLYRHAQPAPERDQVRCEHAEWSHATFGNVGPVGPLKHLSKEALEAAAEPGDLSEWADMQFLLWDAQRRAGITDEQITLAMIEKLAVNKLRDWPEPKDGEPRLHIKEQLAPVVQCVPLGDSPYDVPYSMPSNLRELIAEEIGILFSDDDAQGVWAVCRRAAMLHGGKS